MNVPTISRRDYQLLNIDDQYCTLLDDDGTTRDDLKLTDDEIGKEILEKFANDEEFYVTVLSACSEDRLVGVKNKKSDK